MVLILLGAAEPLLRRAGFGQRLKVGPLPKRHRGQHVEVGRGRRRRARVVLEREVLGVVQAECLVERGFRSLRVALGVEQQQTRLRQVDIGERGVERGAQLVFREPAYLLLRSLPRGHRLLGDAQQCLGLERIVKGLIRHEGDLLARCRFL